MPLAAKQGACVIQQWLLIISWLNKIVSSLHQKIQLLFKKINRSK
jgi:hypothetical protein